MWYALKAAGLLVSLAAVVVPAAAQTVWYVDADAAGANTGTSWANAFTDLQDALGAAEAGDEVWVAEGLYTPTLGSDRTISFVLTSGVALYGGFDGTEQDRDERDWTEHASILSGNIGDPDDPDDNSYHVLVTEQAGTATLLDGLVIADGLADGASPDYDQGAGVLMLGGSPTVRHCTFRENRSEEGGGGIHAESSSPLIEYSWFEDNVGFGGGAHFSNSAPVVRHVTMRGNRTGHLFFEGGSGGYVEDAVLEDGPEVGVYVVGSSPRFVRLNDHRLKPVGS